MGEFGDWFMQRRWRKGLVRGICKFGKTLDTRYRYFTSHYPRWKEGLDMVLIIGGISLAFATFVLWASIITLVGISYALHKVKGKTVKNI